MKNKLTSDFKKIILHFQKEEITDHIVYTNLAKRLKDSKNKEILTKIANDEKEHYEIWKGYTNTDVSPNKLKIFWYSLISYLFGFTFVIKIMEKNEYKTKYSLNDLLNTFPEVQQIMDQEDDHENKLIDMLDEERLEYIGSIVLGLNDALVELTGTIAGVTFAFSNNRLIALSGIITGISATLSMAASNYLAQKAENNPKAFTSSLYTGIAYLLTVVFLVLPYLLLPDNMYYFALLIMIIIVILIILVFNYYVSVTKSLPFKKQFREMLVISLGVALISFLIGIAAKNFLGIDV
ncbi:VIT1/CCC1 family predicted Fe2+/Mn2+ transporter [Bacilli bacterium PM5-3]|nr:VIT1/CCC1 family predicted Fe2+/Mn2+ transporter [Bacilli bacterium PM5-3]